MPNPIARAERRPEPLTRERIVQGAIALLDSEGESGLTFRALSARLATGAGAIYWHVANKHELLSAATDSVVAAAMTGSGDGAAPADAFRAIALGLFDAIDAHPWVGAHLSSEPWQPAVLQIYERIGGQLQALAVPQHALFFTASALVNYVLGVASQNAANARHPAPDGDREAFLTSVAAKWRELDPATHPFMRQMADELPHHDDRQQFLAGIELILAGSAATQRAR